MKVRENTQLKYRPFITELKVQTSSGPRSLVGAERKPNYIT